MRNILLILTLTLMADVFGQECWRGDRFEGYQAHQFDGTNDVDNYEFEQDAYYTGSDKPMEKGFVIVCINSSGASIWHSHELDNDDSRADEVRKSGNKFELFGNSTFVRFSSPLSQEHLDVYQLDRVNKRLIHMKASSPQNDKYPAWGKASSYVGHAILLEKSEAKKYAKIMFK